MNMTDIAKRIDAFISYQSNNVVSHSLDNKYQDIFAEEGLRKADYIINDLKHNSECKKQPLRNYCYLSVGGADGSEVDAVLTHTDIRYAILVEFDDFAAAQAKQRAQRLSQNGKELIVLTGDATQKLDAAIRLLENYKKEKSVTGLVLSMQAIIHELETRSPGFNLNIFLGRCFKQFCNNAFYTREPIAPEEWPSFVELRIPNVKGEQLAILSTIINDKLQISESTPIELADNYVRMTNVLAIEVLHKLRCSSVEHFRYEMQERATSTPIDTIRVLVNKYLKSDKARLERMVTDGFLEFWNTFGIEVRDELNNPLDLPCTHAKIMAFSVDPDFKLNKSEKSNIPATDSIVSILTDFSVCRRDNSAISRRSALSSLLRRIDDLNSQDYDALEARVIILHQLARESRTIPEYIGFIRKIEKRVSELLELNLDADIQPRAAEFVAEWAVDLSQEASSFLEFNKLVARLNEAIKYLGRQIHSYVDMPGEDEKLSSLLCRRAKCRRALGSLFLKRGDSSLESKAKDLIVMALDDAELANKRHQNNSIRFELALCLLATSTKHDSEKAIRGMSLLEIAYKTGFHFLAGYELVKQLRRRHRNEEAIEVFRTIAAVEDDEARFHRNMTVFADAVIGLYYRNAQNGEENTAVKENANLAFSWLEEVIGQDRYNARDIMSFCFISAICGFPTTQAVELINRLDPADDSVWNQLVDISSYVYEGEHSAGEALLLGLEDAMVWNRIGTFYLDFLSAPEKALVYYRRASMIDRRSPVFQFNMARVYAYNLKEFELAEAYLHQARARRMNRYKWYKQNEGEFRKLDELIKQACRKETSSPIRHIR